MMFSKTSVHDYENLCSLDVRRDEVVYDEIKKQLGRLNNFLNNLKRNDQFNTYNDIIRDQQENGIVEKVDEKSRCQNNEYYMPHKAVVRETAQTTKVRIVYDTSATISSKNVSLNECLETGPPLQNLIWGILTRSRFRSILL